MEKKIERTYAIHDEALIDKDSLRESEIKLHAIIRAINSLYCKYKYITGHSMGVSNALEDLRREAERIERDMFRRHPHRKEKYD